MQEVFLSVYRHLSDIKEESIKSYLATSAVNKSRDYLRKNKKYTKIPLEDISELPAKDNALDSAVQSELRTKLTQAISSLKEPYRDVATAYYIRGIPLVMYSKMNNLNPKTAQTRLGRARKKLREILKEEYGDG